MVKNVIDHKRQIKVGAAVLGLGTVLGAGYKKYQNIKINKLQLEKIKALEKKEMLALESELEKYKISGTRKEKIMALVLFGSIGAIILGSKVRSLKKKGGNNKKKTLKN